MKKRYLIMIIIVLLALSAPSSASQEGLYMVANESTFERLLDEGGEFYINWRTYRNT